MSDATLLRLVERALPAPIGEAVAGDLGELWTAAPTPAWRRVAQALDVIVRTRAAALGCVLRRDRVPLAAGATRGALLHLAAWALWRTVLDLVPLRADHPPSLAWLALSAALAAAGALAGTHLVRAIRRAAHPDPDSFA